MKKLRIVILTLISFSAFSSIFFNLAYVIYDKTNNLNNSLINSVKRPIPGNILVILAVFVITLLWYIYHRKDRAESLTNGLMLLMGIAYTVFFVFKSIDYYRLYKGSGFGELWFSFSLIIMIAPGMWIVTAVIPLLLHFIASVITEGYDNVAEPDNIFGFMFTLLGICYILTMVIVGFIGGNDATPSIFAQNENGLIMTITILTFILCAGLRFNSVILDAFNIFMHFIFIVVWFIILIYNPYSGCQIYLGMYHFIMLIPMFILSIFILDHYLKIDRFYKGRTKNFINE